MNPRSTAILFVVAALVVGLVWWHENVRKEQVEHAEAEAQELFPGVEADDLRWVTLPTTGGGEARLEWREGAWQLVEPLAFPADATTAQGIATALADVKSEGVIGSPQAPEVYGLGDDALRVRFGTEDAEYALRVGAKTPVGGATYAAREGGEGGEAVYTIPTFRAQALRRSLLDLRERRVLRFDRAAVARIELAWPGEGVTLERQDGAWQLVAPVRDAADETTVNDLLSDLSFLRAEAFLDEPPPDAEVGLDRPAFEAKLTVPAQGEAQPERIFHVVLGQELEDGQRRAARAREHALYLVASERIDDFPRRVGAYRFKQLASFVPSDAQQLELAFRDAEGGAHVVVAERGDAGWTSAPERLAPGRAARMVAELASLRGTELLADSMGEAEEARLGLAPPRVRLTVRGAARGDEPGPVLAEVRLGEADHDRGIVARDAASPRVYRIDYDLAEHLPVSLEALRNRFLSKEGEGAEDEPDAEDPLEPFDPLAP